jgi:hypothetical protein
MFVVRSFVRGSASAAEAFRSAESEHVLGDTCTRSSRWHTRIIEKLARTARKELGMCRRRIDCHANILVFNMDLQWFRAAWPPKVAHPPHRLVLLELGRYLGHHNHTDAMNGVGNTRLGAARQSARRRTKIVFRCDPNDALNNHGERKDALGDKIVAWGVEQSGWVVVVLGALVSKRP